MRLALALLLVCLLAAVAVAQDALVLDNGRTVRGKIVEETDDAVALEIGGGRIWYPRSTISEIVRGAAGATPGKTVPAAEDEAEPAGVLLRTAFGLLYDGDERVGVREFRLHERVGGGLRIEQRLILPGDDPTSPRVIHTVEESNAAHRPLRWLHRDNDTARPIRVEARVEGEELVVDAVVAGRRIDRRLPLESDVRLPLTAREFFLTESETLGGQLAVRTPDPATLALRKVRFEEGERRKVLPLDDVVEARTIERTVGGRVHRDWVLADGSSYLLDLRGGEWRCLWTRRDLAEAVRDGTAADVTGPDSAARRRFEDAARGWSIGKPDPSWLFEDPLATGGGALLVVRSKALSASVDVLRDPSPPAGVTLERAGEALQRLCRGLASDFRVRSDRYDRKADVPFYEVEAEATRKGEKVFTLGRVLVVDGEVYRLLAACPAEWAEAVVPDLRRILDSFRP